MQVYEDLIAAIEEMICTSTAVMAPYPVDVVEVHIISSIAAIKSS